MTRDPIQTNPIFIYLLALSFVLSGNLFAWAGAGENAGSLPEVVAKVNGQPITADRLAPLVGARTKKYGSFGAQQIAEENLLSIQLQALDKLIEGEVVYQEALKHSVPAAEEKIAAELENLRHRPIGLQEGRSDAELLDLARRQVFTSAFLEDRGFLNPEIPEKDIRALYEEVKESYRQDETVTARHIFVEVPAGALPADDLAARKKIEKARAALMVGTPFADVAKEYSTDATAPQGGELGQIKKGFMPAEFDEAAFDLQVGEISPVIRTSFGYHVLEVQEKHPGGIPPYENMRDFLRQYLQSQVQQKLMAALVAQLRSQAEIEIYLPGARQASQ